ncbi:MAG: NAD(P)H-quinone oxidoreductase subunit L [Leptolyngbya sp. SIO1D8]|nr:NAD(P)H-quinone oxidoreductase subunit L [Leptolyngbya sp. SIO1D8]
MFTDLPFSLDLLITLALYGGLAVAYLLILPAALLFYLKVRWNHVSSVERFLLYGLVFVFFPGLLLLSPLVNFRPQPRSLTP